ncbi:MAG: GTPase Era [Acidobacteria bacterium]|nr:MAG: GTPase Era [Acidobacteriota bacterium]
MKSGSVSLLGRPNVGKSTLFNDLVGAKLASVSPKPQTTRNRITGIVTRPQGQIVFWDLPGIHKSFGVMNKRMVSIALSGLDSVDLGLWVIDAARDSQVDQFMLGHIKSRKPSLILVINKIDLIRHDDLFPMVDLYQKAYDFKEIVPVSALKKKNVEELEQSIFKHLPDGEPLFPEDSLTDVPERALVEEMIREKLFLYMKQEIPYSTAVHVDFWEEKKNLISIQAEIWVEKDSQKGIVIGKGGEMIKKIGSQARLDIEKLLGCKIFLELSVKVKEGWREKPALLDELGIRP